MVWLIIVSNPFQEHSQISKLFDMDDLKCAVSEIMIGAKSGSNFDFPVVQKLRDQLERSSTEIFPFFEACSRKAHKQI